MKTFVRLSKEEQKSLLDRIVESCKSDGKSRTPVVVFDLDGTLMDNRPRSVAIFRELADAWMHRHPEEARAIRKSRPEELAYAVTDSLTRLGVRTTDLLEEATSFWKERFFRDAYLVHDIAIAGAPAFVHELYRAGANIVYLTGRDLPLMGLGSWTSLRDLGFPIGVVGTELVVKPHFDMPDTEFKRAVAPALARLGTVIGVFDNESANCNLLLEAHPGASSIFLDTQHAPDPPPLSDGVAVIDSFLLEP